MSHVTFPAVASFLVLYARELAIDNIGWFFVVSGATSILARPLLGKVSDSVGRGRALLACFILETLGLVMLAFAANLFALDHFRRAVYAGPRHEQLDHPRHRHGTSET